MIPVWRAIPRPPKASIPRSLADIPVSAKKERAAGNPAPALLDIKRGMAVIAALPLRAGKTAAAPITTGVLETYRARGARFHLWEAGDGFTPELARYDAQTFADIRRDHEAILAALKAEPGQAVIGGDLSLGGRSRTQWARAQAFADSEWHAHALKLGWSWDELYGDEGAVWEIGADTVIGVSEIWISKVDQLKRLEMIYRPIDFSLGPKDDPIAIWSTPMPRERLQRPLRALPAPPGPDTGEGQPAATPEPTLAEFLEAIGYRPDGSHVSDGKGGPETSSEIQNPTQPVSSTCSDETALYKARARAINSDQAETAN